MREVNREIGVHGATWNGLHDGYFSNPAMANTLLNAVQTVIENGQIPDVIADLGGGTGFLLTELIQRNMAPQSQLINIDASANQLNLITNPRIQTVCKAINEIKRRTLAKKSERFLLMMRSVLHYFGHAGLIPILRHLRMQLQPGEYFIHQSACLNTQSEADCLNQLYTLMKTHKWYPTRSSMQSILESSGFQIITTTTAPSLRLTETALAERYQLPPTTLRDIHNAMMRHGNHPDIITTTDTSFCAWLPYTVFTCIAI